jgi:hypothetical protein
VDLLSRAYYEVVFERDFLKKTATQFQDFFSEIMEKCHPGDFQRVRPWGNVGDRKNDGYRASQKILFQVYAPNEMEASKTIAKMDEDYREAMPYWEKYFTTWAFVHNSRSGSAQTLAGKSSTSTEAHPRTFASCLGDLRSCAAKCSRWDKTISPRCSAPLLRVKRC